MARKVVTKSFSIPNNLYEQLKIYAELNDVTVSKLLTIILKVYFGGGVNGK